MGREHRILSALYPVYRKVPEPFLYCEDEAVLGAPFYLMEKVEGIIIRKQLPATLSTPDALTEFSGQLVDSLGEIHAIDVDAAGLGDLGRTEGYVRRQIEGWAKRYIAAQTKSRSTDVLIAEWLASHMPSAGATLIHNDYKSTMWFCLPKVQIWWPFGLGNVTLGCPLIFRASLKWVMPAIHCPCVSSVGPTHEEASVDKWLWLAMNNTGRTVDDLLLICLWPLENCGHPTADLHTVSLATPPTIDLPTSFKGFIFYPFRQNRRLQKSAIGIWPKPESSAIPIETHRHSKTKNGPMCC